MGRKEGGRGERRKKKREGKERKVEKLTDLEDSSGSGGKDYQPEITTSFNSVLRVTSRALLDLAHISPHTLSFFTLLLQMC